MTKLPLYLYELIPPLQRSRRCSGCLQTFRCRNTFLHNSFLPFTITEWNKLYSHIKNIDFHAMFHKKLLNFMRPLENDPLGVWLLNRLRLGFSHLRKLKHNLADTLNPLCSCSLETEDTEHYFLRCQNNLSFRITLMNDLNNIYTAIASLNSNDQIE